MAPNDRIKVQMQLSASEGRPFKGVVDCGKYIVAEHGVFNSKGLFRGWTATAVLEDRHAYIDNFTTCISSRRLRSDTFVIYYSWFF